MSLVFSAVLAAAFYTFVLGAIWPPRDGSDFAAALLGLIAKSLWLSWLVVAVSYWLNLYIPAPALYAAAGLGLAWQWLRGGRQTVLTHAFPVVLVFSATAMLCLFYFIGGLGSDYRSIFVTTDALESWNNWAMQLSANTYKPYNAAYPLLFPGLWSLVYKAQGTPAVWIVAKVTLFVVPVILGSTICLLLSSRLLITGAVYAGFAAIFFFSGRAYPMLLGDMDMPVAVMCMACGVAMVVAVHKNERGEPSREIVILSALFAGLAAITKQPGVIMLLPILVLLVVGLWRGWVGRCDALIAVAAAAIPLASFMTMFLAQRPSPIGNLDNLERIRAMAGPPLALAWHQVEGMMPLWLLAALALLALTNVFYLRRLSGWMGLLFLALGVAGFFGFAKCCAYDARNGWWIISLLATSALFTLSRFDPLTTTASVIRAPAHFLPTAAAAFAVAATLMVQDRVSDAEIESQQFHAQENIPGEDVSLIIRKSLQPILNRGDTLLSEFSAARWFPGMVNHYAFCVSVDKPCIERVFNDPKRALIFVLVRPGVLEYPSLVGLLTPDRLMAKSGGYELYGPLHAADVPALR
jgi:hypothetical protein